MANNNSLKDTLVRLLDITDEDASKQGSVVFLNGPWGCGKTFFWKTTLLPSLTTKKVGYVSLFGVSNIADLKAKLRSAIIAGDEDENLLGKGRRLLSWASSPLSKVLEKYAGFDLDWIELVPWPFVICFDDLERLPGASNMEEILGFINYLSEHKNFRCLVVLNEKELKKKKEHASDFKRLREKLGLRRFELPFDIEARTSDFVKHSEGVFDLKLSDREREHIKSAILRAAPDNLRVVRFTLECYFQLRKGLKKEIPDSVVDFLVAIVHHESQGKSKDWDFYFFDSMSIAFRKYRRKEKEEEPDEQTLFHKEYFGESSKYRPTRCVYEIVKNGHFDIESALDDLFPKKEDLSEVESYSEEIKEAHFFFWEDSELEELSNRINIFFSDNAEMSLRTVAIFSKSLTSSARLLSKPEITTLPPNYEAITAAAAKETDKIDDYIRHSPRRDDTFPVFIDTLIRVCKDERKRRLTLEVGKAISEKKYDRLEYDLLQKNDVLRSFVTDGYLEKAWEIKERESKSHVIEHFLKGAVQAQTHDEGVKSELLKAHQFLKNKYESDSMSKMEKLRTFRLLQEIGLDLPSPPESLVPRKKEPLPDGNAPNEGS